MTIGTRIAQKRKERGLSQEALGEQLGVSRQAIYKWESDSALPEIEKLIALSRLFGVSVGWLLGVEDETPPAAEDSGELTESQLNMVEEIVARYLAAQPQPPKRRKWPFVLAGFALLVAVFSLVHRLDEISQQYQRVQMTVSNVQSSVNNQINGISNRVEEILKAHNALTADYGTQLIAGDLARGTVTFTARAVPKTYQEGMDAVFLADSGDGPADFPAELAPGRTFTGEISTVLTDNISLSVVFIYPDGTRQTQLLDSYEGLLSATYPKVILNGSLTFMDVKDGAVTFKTNEHYLYQTVRLPDGNEDEYAKGLRAADVASVQLGIFRNKTLVAWASPCEKPASYIGWEEDYWRFFMVDPNLTVALTHDDVLSVAVVVTDEYGREFVRSDDYRIDSDGSELMPYSLQDYTDIDWTY